MTSNDSPHKTETEHTTTRGSFRLVITGIADDLATPGDWTQLIDDVMYVILAAVLAFIFTPTLVSQEVISARGGSIMNVLFLALGLVHLVSIAAVIRNLWLIRKKVA